MPEQFEVYEKAANLLQKSWGQTAYATPNGKFCLVGGLYFGAKGFTHQDILLSADLCRDVDEQLMEYPLYRILHNLYEVERRPEKIQFIIEFWNDVPWRRKKTVVASLRALQARCEAQWLHAQIVHLNATVNRLMAERLELLAEIDSMRNENSFWRNIVKKQTLAKKHKELKIVRASLETTQDQLERMQSVALTYE